MRNLHGGRRSSSSLSDCVRVVESWALTDYPPDFLIVLSPVVDRLGKQRNARSLITLIWIQGLDVCENGIEQHEVRWWFGYAGTIAQTHAQFHGRAGSWL